MPVLADPMRRVASVCVTDTATLLHRTTDCRPPLYRSAVLNAALPHKEFVLAEAGLLCRCRCLRTTSARRP